MFSDCALYFMALLAAASMPVGTPAIGGGRRRSRSGSRLPSDGSGVPGTVRIVAQIQADPQAVLSPVQFYVDGKLLSSVEGGPPYAAEWVDENPFEPREISVAVADSLGNTARDKVVLKAARSR